MIDADDGVYHNALWLFSARAPSRIFFQLRLAEQYFRLIFGSARFTRTGENVAELRLVAQFAAKIWLKQ